MLRALRLLPFLLLVEADGQIWCPPGATWTYEALYDLGGFVRMSYTGDTLIDGEAAQVIDRFSAAQFAGGGAPVYNHVPVARITKVAGDVVYLRGNQGWDTLYWFGATPGNGYTAPFQSWCSSFLILENGTDVFDGVPLDWYSIGSIHRIYERLGYTWHIDLTCPGDILLAPAALRCYSDNEISVQLTTAGCEDFVGVGDPPSVAMGSPYPNPGTDHFTLSLPPGPHTIALFDATGRCVLRERANGERTVVPTSGLAPGLYHVRAEDGAPILWLKE